MWAGSKLNAGLLTLGVVGGRNRDNLYQLLTPVAILFVLHQVQSPTAHHFLSPPLGIQRFFFGLLHINNGLFPTLCESDLGYISATFS